jgi:isopentenyldiphosphate isomerase
MSHTEWVDVVDETDRVIGRASRAEVRAHNLLHRNVAILCQDAAGRIYLHQRSATKDLFPNLHDVFVSGVVGAGENYDTAAVRELSEEVGIENARPELLFRHRYEGAQTRSHTAVYRVLWDGPMRHHDGEIAWGRFCTLAEIEQNAARWPLVPDGAEIFARYLRTSGARTH